MYNNIKKIRSSGILEHLITQLRQPLAIFIFGSYAKSENTRKSDIDLFIITNTKQPIDTQHFEKKLHAPIQLFVHTPAEVEQLKQKNPHLINNVLNGIRL